MGANAFFNAIEVSASEDGAACMLPFFLQFIDKIDINHKTKNQSYPLLAAAETGSPEALQMLLNLPGIDIQCHNSGGMDVLQVAAWYNNKKKVQLLLDRSDIDPLKVTNRGKTAYDLTIEPEIKAMIRDAIAKRGSQATITHEKNS